MSHAYGCCLIHILIDCSFEIMGSVLLLLAAAVQDTCCTPSLLRANLTLSTISYFSVWKLILIVVVIRVTSGSIYLHSLRLVLTVLNPMITISSWGLSSQKGTWCWRHDLKSWGGLKILSLCLVIERSLFSSKLLAIFLRLMRLLIAFH